MPSINFNQSALVALDTLRTINMNLEKTQNVISTGKEIANARDNAAVWAISKVMESDVSSFEAIEDSLNLGAATIGVARGASEQATELLKEMKTLIVSAQEENVDRNKIQRDINALRDQVKSIVDAAQFNGLNLLKGGANVEVLSSLDRNDVGVVTPRNISINTVDLTETAGTRDLAAGLTGGTAGAASLQAGADISSISTASGVTTGTIAAATPSTATGSTAVVTFGAAAAGVTETYTFDIGGATVTSTQTWAGTETADQVRDAILADLQAATVPTGITFAAGSGAGELEVLNSSAADVNFDVDDGTAAQGAISSVTATDGNGEAIAVDTTDPDGNTVDGDLILNAAVPAFSDTKTAQLNFSVGDVSAGALFELEIGNNFVQYRAIDGDTAETVAQKLRDRATAIAPENFTLTASATSITFVNGTGNAVEVSASAYEGTSGGALEDLANISVTTNDAAASALLDIEVILESTIDAAASFGSAQKRIDIQKDFVIDLQGSLQAGISALTDADLEEASARLQSLQVQQQLNIQALTIANQSPQSILALFR